MSYLLNDFTVSAKVRNGGVPQEKQFDDFNDDNWFSIVHGLCEWSCWRGDEDAALFAN